MIGYILNEQCLILSKSSSSLHLHVQTSSEVQTVSYPIGTEQGKEWLEVEPPTHLSVLPRFRMCGYLLLSFLYTFIAQANLSFTFKKSDLLKSNCLVIFAHL
jgi:hypothetical protein